MDCVVLISSTGYRSVALTVCMLPLLCLNLTGSRRSGFSSSILFASHAHSLRCARVFCSLLRALSALSLRPRQSFLPPSRPTGSSHTASGVASRALLVPAPLPRAAPFAPTVCWDSISSHCTLPYGAVTFPMLMSLSGRVPHGSPDRGGPCSWLEVGMRISC